MLIRHILKRQLGQEFHRCRKKQSLGLQAVADHTGYSWQKIDKVEIGQTFSWDIYNKLLNFYNKKIELTLVDSYCGVTRRQEEKPSALPADERNSENQLLKEVCAGKAKHEDAPDRLSDDDEEKRRRDKEKKTEAARESGKLF